MPVKVPVIVIASVLAVCVACGQSNPVAPSNTANGAFGAAPDGSTLKIGAPTLTSPSDNFNFPAGSGVVTLTWTNVSGTYATFPVSYEVEVKNAAGAVVANPKSLPASPGGTTSWTVNPPLVADTVHTFRVRATFNQAFGPWSAGRQFKTGPLAFLSRSQSTVFDPLTNGFSVGDVRGGRFSPEGWTALGRSDGIDYDIATCGSCRLEFDVLGFDDGLHMFGIGEAKILSMGDANTFGSFGAFRDHEWKMHFSIRSDGDGTGIDVVWRNGGFGEGNNPGDHRQKIEPGPRWSVSQASHIVAEWTPRGYKIFVNGVEWAEEDFEGDAYVPDNHRISLGCYPRGETFEFATFRNVRLTPFN
jgi:hypothetical protein